MLDISNPRFVIEKMEHLFKISLRKANFQDIEFLWYLRNQPDVYKYSLNDRKVSWEEHIGWFFSIILGLVPKDIFIIKKGGLPLGYIRFNYEKDKKAIISIALCEKFRGKGLGIQAFRKAALLLKRKKGVKQILANVHKNNILSQKFFEKLKFELKERKGNWLKYILDL